MLLDGNSTQSLPSALKKYNEIFEKIKGKTLAIFLDYDGTLTPIVKDPSDAKLSSKMRNLIEKIAKIYSISIISGRDRKDVENLVKVENLIYAGSHGFDIKVPGKKSPNKNIGNKFLPSLDKVEKKLSSLKSIKGVIIERKLFSIAVHYRMADESQEDFIEEKVDEILSEHNDLKKGLGKKVFELRPNIDWDKGKALESLLNILFIDTSNVVPLYIGDDITDEDAFKSIAERGVGIYVGDEDRLTYANYSLKNISEVNDFLYKVLDMPIKQVMHEPWKLTYTSFVPKEEGHREALCTLGNGYFATRGASAESKADGIHYPGTYISGCFNRLSEKVQGHVIENESLVNMPNWLCLDFKISGQWFDPARAELLEYKQELDIRKGTLSRIIRFVDKKKRYTKIVQRRLCSMTAHNVGAIQTEIIPENWSGTIQVKSAIDGTVENTGIERYNTLDTKHLELIKTKQINDEIISLQVKTNQSHIYISESARTRVFSAGHVIDVDKKVKQRSGYIAQNFSVKVSEQEPIIIEKIASIHTSRDRGMSEDFIESIKEVKRASDFEDIYRKHLLAWDHLWKRCRLEVKTEEIETASILQLHVFHLLQTVSTRSIDLDVGVPPRGLHGEAYRGHILWDELFIFPFLNLRIPDITKTLLQYRFRRLPEARWIAKQEGYKGALYPWQSGSDGREESQFIHLNPCSGRWIPDNSRLQRHVNIAIAYNLWQYYLVSGDLDFLSYYGAEVFLEIARFWDSISEYNESLDRYEIKRVMGPDEFHDGYPDTKEPGINNNSYTNIMVVWIFCRALEMLKILPEQRRVAVIENLEITEEELKRWEDISRKMLIVFHGDGIISQFEGYGDLLEFDWDLYKKKYPDIHRLDRILEAENDTPNRYKLSKQADALMLFFVLSERELREIFARLDYPFDENTITKNVDYYLARTSHGSTLSRVVHSWTLARSRRDLSWFLFKDALKSDIADIQGGTTSEGIHLGAMAGTVDLVQRCYTGLDIHDDTLILDPCLPEEMEYLDFDIYYHKQWLNVHITKKTLKISFKNGATNPINLAFRKRKVVLKPGKSVEFKLS